MSEWEQLQSTFGGRWDGARPEIHGLVERGGSRLKIELLYSERRARWSASVFAGGACVASGSAPEAAEAVERALDSVEE
jgi:hypothetical protein